MPCLALPCLADAGLKAISKCGAGGGCKSPYRQSVLLNDGGRTADKVVATIYVSPYYLGSATPDPAD